MSVFRVWAPHAGRVELAGGGKQIAMRAQSDGWWEREVREWGPGTDYAFVLDGGKPLPDPRSSWQPHGVHDPSRVVGHNAFHWTDVGWQSPPLASGVLYELHVGTFTPEGTFDAAITRLDHLVGLGITHVELMPVAEFAGDRGWGYDGVDLYAPHHAYGGPDGLKRFVDACHMRGLAAILDVVYNHLGPEGNYLHRFGPYFTSRYPTYWGQAVNLDGPGSDEVRRFLCDNALAWLRDYHFDGLRLDAVHAIVDTSAVHFLAQLAEEVESLAAQLGRPLVLVAESDLNDPRIVRSRDVGGYGLDALWNEDFHHALHAALTGERCGYYGDFGRLADVAKALERGFVYDGRRSAYRGRRHGRPATGLSGHHFVGFLQNHDQVGNRPQGERASQLLTPEQLRVAAALVLTAPFVPMLFQGEEWGASTPFHYFTDHGDPNLVRAVREGRREELVAFGWDAQDLPDPQDSETFRRSQLDWRELEHEPHRSLLDWHRRLITLRRGTSALTDGRLDRLRVAFDEEARWLRMDRGPISVACNLGPRSALVPRPPGGPVEVVLTSRCEALATRDGVEIPAAAAVVLRCVRGRGRGATS
jgi:maltooligosyltrehalose trehalohydrolase